MNLQTKEEITDYNIYIMSPREKILNICLAGLALFVIGFIFFNHAGIAALFILAAFKYPKYRAQHIVKKRRGELNLQFKDALYFLASAVSVGKSLQSAFKIALSDLKILYPEENVYIIREFELINRRVMLNEPVEAGLADFARRSGLEDVVNFSEVMAICRQTGGNLVQVIKNTANIINEKIEISQDIELLLAKQKYEQKILNVMPLVFIGLIKFGGSGYINSLYSSATGYFIMGLALMILALSFVISRKIFDIKV